MDDVVGYAPVLVADAALLLPRPVLPEGLEVVTTDGLPTPTHLARLGSRAALLRPDRYILGTADDPERLVNLCATAPPIPTPSTWRPCDETLTPFTTAGRASYGIVADDGIVDLGARFPSCRRSATSSPPAGIGSPPSPGQRGPRRGARRGCLRPGHPEPRQDHLRRPELPRPCRRDRPDRDRQPGALRPLRWQPDRARPAAGEAPRVSTSSTTKASSPLSSARAGAASPRRRRSRMSRAMPATTTARCATGSATPASSCPARPSPAPAPSVRGW